MDTQQIASAREVAQLFRGDCRALHDSLQLEMVVAQYLLRLRDARTAQGVPVGDAIAAGVIDALARQPDRLSHAILRGISHLATGDSAERGAAAVADLADRGVELPPQFADVGKVRASGAWRTANGGLPGEYVLFAEFQHELGARHSLALFVEPRRGGVVKHIALLGAISEVDPHGAFHPSAMDELDVAEAGAVLREVLERSFGRELTRSDDFRVIVAAARALHAAGAALCAKRQLSRR
jgi:hypothetical protein